MAPPVQRASRLARESELLARDPPFGVMCWPDGDRADVFHAQIVGLAGTPYETGVFELEVVVAERYPYEPPSVRFLTQIYHPNIDTGGRICLDVLKMPPKGAWKPSINIGTVLASIQQLMAEPNPDDALMSDIASQFTYRRAEFERQAREWTLKYAVDKPIVPSMSPSASSASSVDAMPAPSQAPEPSAVTTANKENASSASVTGPPAAKRSLMLKRPAPAAVAAALEAPTASAANPAVAQDASPPAKRRLV